VSDVVAAQWPAQLQQHQNTGTKLKRRNHCHSLSRRNQWALEQRWVSVNMGMVGKQRHAEEMRRWSRLTSLQATRQWGSEQKLNSSTSSEHWGQLAN